MVAIRTEAARFAATNQLNTLWRASERDDPWAIIATAAARISQSFGISISYLPAIGNRTQVAGEYDREHRRITVSTRFPAQSQRFTIAHELGHFFLHTGEILFREIGETGTFQPQLPEEIEANCFAAELLMPMKLLRPAFTNRFGQSLQLQGSGEDLSEFLESLAYASGTLPTKSSSHTAALGLYEKAKLLAGLHIFWGKPFMPLAEAFNVSRSAMARQLIDARLVQ